MRHAVFTIVQGEPFFFPIWYKYYSQQFKSRHIYVLYHALPEEEGLEPMWLRAPVYADTSIVRIFCDKSFDHLWLRERVEQFAAFLLGSYDTVTFAEADEIIALDPALGKDGSLPGWLDDWCLKGQPAARCAGYEVIHKIGEEPDLDLDEVRSNAGRVLKNRGWWYPSQLYSKTLTWRVPPHWCGGFHWAYSQRGDPNIPGSKGARLDLPVSPGLLLLHLHRVDWQVAVARWRSTAARNWNDRDRQHAQAGLQNRFTSEAQLRAWWYKNIDDFATNATLVRMPDGIKSIV